MRQLNTPLQFTPYYSETIWGGRRLSDLFAKQLPPEVRVGESWEISSIDTRETVVANGHFQGKTLTELYREDPVALIGPQSRTTPAFPLLLKFIDANDCLSIQVHPDDTYARTQLGYPFGKTECWYIADAGAGGTLGIGLKQEITREQFRAAIAGNSFGELLHTVKVHTGEVYIIPAGTIHAILNDLIIYEVQQSSDATFRLYDWQRKDASGNYRKLAIEKGIAVTNLVRRDNYRLNPLVLSENEYLHSVRTLCPYFALEELACNQQKSFLLPQRSSCRIVTVLSGEVELSGDGFTQTATKGMTLFLPAACSLAQCSVASHCHLLLTTLPGGERDVMQDLQSAGYSEVTIASLQ